MNDILFRSKKLTVLLSSRINEISRRELEPREKGKKRDDDRLATRRTRDERGKRRIKKRTACESHRRQRTFVIRVHICAARAIYNAAERY